MCKCWHSDTSGVHACLKPQNCLSLSTLRRQRSPVDQKQAASTLSANTFFLDVQLQSCDKSILLFINYPVYGT